MPESLNLLESSGAIAQRSDDGLKSLRLQIFKRTDRLFAYLMIFQWLFGILCAPGPS